MLAAASFIAATLRFRHSFILLSFPFTAFRFHLFRQLQHHTAKAIPSLHFKNPQHKGLSRSLQIILSNAIFFCTDKIYKKIRHIYYLQKPESPTYAIVAFHSVIAFAFTHRNQH
jgi:hypothetical protein